MRVPTHRCRFIHSGQHLISDLVAFSGNRYAAMHYNVARVHTRISFQHFNTACENPASSSAPSGVQKRDRSRPTRNQIDRNAVGDGYQQEGAWRDGSVAIESFFDGPATGRPILPVDLAAMYLMRKDGGAEFRERGAKLPPPPHYLAHRPISPEPEVEWRGRVASPAGDPRDDAEPFAPPGNLPERNRSGDRHLLNRRHARSGLRGRAGGYRSAHSRARSGRCC